MSEPLTVSEYMELSKRLEHVGLVLLIRNDMFNINVKEANCVIKFDNLRDLRMFIKGYELGYKSGL